MGFRIYPRFPSSQRQAELDEFFADLTNQRGRVDPISPEPAA